MAAAATNWATQHGHWGREHPRWPPSRQQDRRRRPKRQPTKFRPTSPPKRQRTQEVANPPPSPGTHGTHPTGGARRWDWETAGPTSHPAKTTTAPERESGRDQQAPASRPRPQQTVCRQRTSVAAEPADLAIGPQLSGPPQLGRCRPNTAATSRRSLLVALTHPNTAGQKPAEALVNADALSKSPCPSPLKEKQ